ncbi:hypothetical protein J6590_029684, partial [Homalodisca vitripennis]
LSEEQSGRFRCEASVLLRKIPSANPNLTIEEKKAMSILGKDDTILHDTSYQPINLVTDT